MSRSRRPVWSSRFRMRWTSTTFRPRTPASLPKFASCSEKPEPRNRCQCSNATSSSSSRCRDRRSDRDRNRRPALVYIRKTIVILMTLATMTLASTSLALGADDPVKTGFVNFDAGAQPMRRTISASSTFSIYDETGSVDASERIRNGAVFDVSGGVRVWQRIAIGAGFSSFGRSGSGTLSASIPHPAFYDRKLTAVREVTDLQHSERAVHVRVTWFKPINDRVDVALAAGPSFIKITQGVATSIAVQPGTQNFTVNQATEKG